MTLRRLASRLTSPRLTLAPALACTAALLLAPTACGVNPATAAEGFAAFMSPAEERRIGAEHHPKLVAAFGGLYDDPGLQRYVESIGRLLQATSEQPTPPYTFVILDSPIVNAFALPGGYVHVTRGLMALANDEAELAGVIAHEIGHVTARHSAERYSQGLIAGLGAAILGAVVDSDTVSDIARFAAGAYVQGYSRSQELEADTLGVRYLARGGFDATAMSSFLAAMEAEAALARRIAGARDEDPLGGLFASHPRTAERVRKSANAAKARFGGDRAREIYLRKIDGMIYGDSPDEGIVRGREFAHPLLRIAFRAPPGFRLRNTPEALFGTHRSGALMRFDGATLEFPWHSTWRYLQDEWASDTTLDSVDIITVRGLEAAVGTTRINTDRGLRDVRLVAIRDAPDHVYRFLFLTPPERTRALGAPFRRSVDSFRRLDEREAAAFRPLRLRVVAVEPGQSVATLADRMAFDDFRVERFRVLNGLAPGARLRPGQLVKIVTD